MFTVWSVFGECRHPFLIDDIYNGDFPSKDMSKEGKLLVKKLRDVNRLDITPSDLLSNIKIYDSDCRKNVLEKVAKYDVPFFRIISTDKLKRIVVPSDKRFMVGLYDDWRGLHIRAHYVDAIISIYDNNRPVLKLELFKEPKKKFDMPYRLEEVISDAELIKSFTT